MYTEYEHIYMRVVTVCVCVCVNVYLFGNIEEPLLG